MTSSFSPSNIDPAVLAADRVLTGADGSPNPEEAGRLYERALVAGSGEAAERLAVLTAMGVARTADFPLAFDYLARSADLGHRPAQKQLAIFADRKDLTTRAPKAPIWGKVRADIDLDALLRPPPGRREHLSPAIAVLESFIPRSFCRWIVDRGRGRLTASKVNHIEEGGARADSMRTAEAAAFGLTDTDLVVVVVQERLVRASHVPLYCHEPPNLLHYGAGQQYRPHFDFIDPRIQAFHEELRIFGQRIGTCLVYLNDDFDGGETAFPRLGWKYRGKPGDALLFNNVTTSGQPDVASLHAGLPPTRGEKWLLSLWLRDRVQPLG